MAQVTPPPDPIYHRIQRAGRAHRRATGRLAEARDELYAAILEGLDADLSLGAVAELAGVSKGLVQQVKKGDS